jgi:hypothetical protein
MRSSRSDNGDALREQAIERLAKKRDFQAHLLAFTLVNATLWVIWAMTGAGFPWPVFPLLGWGIGMVFHAWDVFGAPPTEARIQREIARLRSGS